MYPCPPDLAGENDARLVLTPLLRWPRDRPLLQWAVGQTASNYAMLLSFVAVSMFGGCVATAACLGAIGRRHHELHDWCVAMSVLLALVVILAALIGFVIEYRRRVRHLFLGLPLAFGRRNAAPLVDVAVAGVGFRPLVALRLLHYARLDAFHIALLRHVLPTMAIATLAGLSYPYLGGAHAPVVALVVLFAAAHALLLHLLRDLVLPAYGAAVTWVILQVELWSVRLHAARATDTVWNVLQAPVIAVCALAIVLAAAEEAQRQFAPLFTRQHVGALVMLGIAGTIVVSPLYLLAGSRWRRAAAAWFARYVRRRVREGERLYPAALERLGGR